MKTRAGDNVGDTGAVHRIIRRDEMQAVTGYCIDHIYALIRKEEFPKPIPLGARAVGWLSADINKWQQQRIAARDRKIKEAEQKKTPASV